MEVFLVDLKAGRLCTADILYNNKSYSVELAKNACYENEIRTGKVIQLKYLKEYDKFIIPESNTLIMYYISFLFFIVPLFFLIKILRSTFYKKLR